MAFFFHFLPPQARGRLAQTSRWFRQMSLLPAALTTSLVPRGGLRPEHLRSPALRQLRDLDLAGNEDVDSQFFEALPYLPLRRLNLSSTTTNGYDLAHLEGFPLQHLDLSYAQFRRVDIWDEHLIHLKDMPLRWLSLADCEDLSDAGIEHLRHLPLEHLDLSGCTSLTDAAMWHLERMPLRSLNLSECFENNRCWAESSSWAPPRVPQH